MEEKEEIGSWKIEVGRKFSVTGSVDIRKEIKLVVAVGRKRRILE